MLQGYCAVSRTATKGPRGLIATREGIVVDLLPSHDEPVRLGEVADVTAWAHHHDPG